MKRCTVFYGQQVHDEADGWLVAYNQPDGAYMRWQESTVVWYQHRFGGWVPINLSDLSPEVQLILLLMT